MSKTFWKLINYVEDRSWVLSNESLKKYNKKFSDLENDKKNQVFTLFFPNSFWKNISLIWNETFYENEIWKKTQNNWLLLLVSTEEKKMEIIVWKWLNSIYTKWICKNILETRLRYFLQKRDYDGILKVWYEIVKYEKFEKKSLHDYFLNFKENHELWNKIFLKIFLWFIIIFIIILFNYFFINLEKF